MTLEEARNHIGAGVVYRSYPDAQAEDGTIVRVSGEYVMVRYGRESVKATSPYDLTFLTQPCSPLCGATKAYGKSAKWWQHDWLCPVRRNGEINNLPKEEI